MKRSKLTETVLRALRPSVKEAEEEEVDIEDEEEINIKDKKEVDIDDESVESDIEVKTMVPGESADVAAVQGLLMKAQQQATKLGGEKLLAQIGNTIIYFIRTHGVKAKGAETEVDENRNSKYNGLAERVVARIKETKKKGNKQKVNEIFYDPSTWEWIPVLKNFINMLQTGQMDMAMAH